MTRQWTNSSSVPLWTVWGGGLTAMAAAVLYLSFQSGFLPAMVDLARIWQDEPNNAVFDANASSGQQLVAAGSHTYSLFYADGERALIVYRRNLIVVHPGAALPDGSRVSSLRPDHLVTTRGRTFYVR